jgi:hypothetical protein
VADGITSWMPVYASGRPVGWTLDFMRRNTEPGSFHGVMEFLIATAALTFREEGARFVSLSGAPLARLDRGEQPSARQRLLDMIADTMEPAYGFQSLLQFKAKFQPAYQPLYLTYPDPAALGSIATAIGRAYLPHLTLRQALRLLTKLHRPHAHRGPVHTKSRSQVYRSYTPGQPASARIRQQVGTQAPIATSRLHQTSSVMGSGFTGMAPPCSPAGRGAVPRACPGRAGCPG